jgi:hypothetical protein
MPGQVTVNLTPNGFMTPDTPITVKSSESLDAKSAQGAITIEGQQVYVVLSDDGHTAEVRTDGLVSGLRRLRPATATTSASAGGRAQMTPGTASPGRFPASSCGPHWS